METFTAAKELAENLRYKRQRMKTLAGLTDAMIDTPIIDIIKDFNQIPCCFTMQSCYGHFLFDGQEDPYNLEPLPDTNTIQKVEYRIAYLAFCIENSEAGRNLLRSLMKITAIDPDNIQFGSAEWFWGRQVNSYVLQVEPDRYKHLDKAFLEYREALHTEKVRKAFFFHLKALLQGRLP